MKILITGAAGFIGSHLANYCLDQGHEVLIIDNEFGLNIKIKNSERLEFQKCDVADAIRVEATFKWYKPDVVYHLAAYASEGRSNHIRSFIHSNNTVGTANVINACVNHKCKLVFTSSVAVYSGSPPFTETMRPDPIDEYGLSKYMSECSIKIACDTQGLDYCIIRPRNCYDDQTEILTNSGWKKFADLNSWDTVATLNPDNNELEYHLPTDYQKIPYNGKMIHFKSASIDMCVTPDHKMYVNKNTRNSNKKMEFVTANQLVKSKTAYNWKQKQKANYNSGVTPKFINIPEMNDSLGRKGGRNQNYGAKQIDSLLWAEFIGWYVSEGSRFHPSSGHYVVVISQYKRVNPYNYEAIKKLVTAMGFNYYLPKDETEIKIYSRQLFFALEECGLGNLNKKIPNNLLHWDKKHLGVLFDSLMKGDGHKSRIRYNTTSKILADQVTEIMLKLGMAFSVRCETSKRDTPIYRIDGKKRSQWLVLGNMRTKSVYAKEEDYEGYVYDVTVPNHIIFVRRNGKSVWSSNCYGPGQNMWDRSRNLFGIWMYNALHDLPLTIFGDGTQCRTFTYIDDIIPCLYRAKDVKDEIINLGSAQPYDINAACETFMVVTGYYGKFIRTEARHEVKEAFCNTKKSVDLLGFKDKTTLESGLSHMWDWAKNQPERPLQSMPPLEVQVNAHSSLK